ncbi:MAG: hypothetical protein ABH842_04980 [Candidatus Micrarchaeota archaeon]
MDDDTRTMFFTLIWYSGEVDGNKIVEVLSRDHNENVKKLAIIGQTIVAVVKGETSTSELSKISEMFDKFPSTDYWMKFVEVSGQVLLTRALEMVGHKETKKELTKYGLELLSKVTSSGFALNKTTIQLLKMISDREFSAQAILLVRQNGVLKKPDLGLRASIGRRQYGTGGRNRTAVG